MDKSKVITSISSIEYQVVETICNMVNSIVDEGKAIKGENDIHFIPLDLIKNFNQYKYLVVHSKSCEILSDTESIDFGDAVLELKTAILTDLAMRYFEVEDI